jgi:copper chaperone
MLQFQVEGMSCSHCVKAVTQAIVGEYPQAHVDVDLAVGKVSVDQGDAGRIADLIKDAGYSVVSASA